MIANVIVNGHDSGPVLLHSGTFTINRFVPIDTDITRIELQFSKGEKYGHDSRLLSAYINEISVKPMTDLMPILATSDRRGDNFQVHGVDIDGWAEKSASLHLPPSDAPKALELKIESPAWAAGGAGSLAVSVDDKEVYAQAVAAGNYQTIAIPLANLCEKTVTLHAQNVLARPNQKDKRRSYRIVAMSLRDLAPNERVEGGTVRALPRYELTGADQDGWTGRRAHLLVPSSTQATAAEFQLEFPGWANAPTGKFVFTLNGRVVYSEELLRGVYKTVRVPLEPGRDNDLVLEASQEFPLPAPDQRVRSYRIVKLDLQ